LFLSSRKYDPGCSSQIQIPDPDPDFFIHPGSGPATLVAGGKKAESSSKDHRKTSKTTKELELPAENGTTPREGLNRPDRRSRTGAGAGGHTGA
jgi:hypothetical protein